MAQIGSVLIIEDNTCCEEFLSLAFLSQDGFDVLTKTRPSSRAMAVKSALIQPSRKARGIHVVAEGKARAAPGGR